MTHPRSTVWCAGRVICDALEHPEGPDAARREWLAARRNYVCASEVAKAMGIPWTKGAKERHRTGPERYAELIAKKRAPLDLDDIAPSEQAWWGREMEPYKIERLSRAPGAPTEGWSIRQCGLLIQDAQCPDLAATADMWCDDGDGPMVGDLKDSGFAWRATQKNPDILHHVPMDYQIQMQAQMACTGATRGVLVQHAGNYVANCIIFHRDEAMIARIRQAAEWAMMEVRAAA